MKEEKKSRKRDKTYENTVAIFLFSFPHSRHFLLFLPFFFCFTSMKGKNIYQFSVVKTLSYVTVKLFRIECEHWKL